MYYFVKSQKKNLLDNISIRAIKEYGTILKKYGTKVTIV